MKLYIIIIIMSTETTRLIRDWQKEEGRWSQRLDPAEGR